MVVSFFELLMQPENLGALRFMQRFRDNCYRGFLVLGTVATLARNVRAFCAAELVSTDAQVLATHRAREGAW